MFVDVGMHASSLNLGLAGNYHVLQFFHLAEASSIPRSSDGKKANCCFKHWNGPQVSQVLVLRFVVCCSYFINAALMPHLDRAFPSSPQGKLDVARAGTDD